MNILKRVSILSILCCVYNNVFALEDQILNQSNIMTNDKEQINKNLENNEWEADKLSIVKGAFKLLSVEAQMLKEGKVTPYIVGQFFACISNESASTLEDCFNVAANVLNKINNITKQLTYNEIQQLKSYIEIENIYNCNLKENIIYLKSKEHQGFDNEIDIFIENMSYIMSIK